MLGLENVGPYMQSKEAQKLAEWTEVPLDNEGKLIQEEMTRKFQVRPQTFFFIDIGLTYFTLAVAIAWHQNHVSCLHRSSQEVYASLQNCL